jgi:hypothetical protein
MRRLILKMSMSLDGVVAGADGGRDQMPGTDRGAVARMPAALPGDAVAHVLRTAG